MTHTELSAHFFVAMWGAFMLMFLAMGIRWAYWRAFVFKRKNRK